MPNFEITSPDGAVYNIEAPEGATEQDAIAYAQQQHAATNPPAQKQEPQIFNMGSGYGADFQQGALFGTADKAMSGGTALYQAVKDAYDKGTIKDFPQDLKDYYNTDLSIYREGQKQFDQQNPATSTGMQLLGGLASGGALMGSMATAPTLLGRMAQSANIAVPIGAVSGFIKNDGGLSARTQQSQDDALLYGTLGAVTPAVVEGSVGLAKGAYGALKGTAQGGANIAGNYINPENTALRKIGEAIRNDTIEISPEDFINRIKQGYTPAEAGGSNIEAMADALAQQPGPARPFLQNLMEKRVAGQRDEITNLIAHHLGSDGVGTNAIEMAQEAKARIAPLAELAFNGDNSVIGSDARIQALLQNPDVKAGLPRGLQILRNEADASGKPFNPTDYAITDFNAAGDPIIGGVPNMRLIDATKRGLDAQINANSNEFGHLNDLGRSQYLLKQALVGRAKELNPAYADYLNNAASEFSLQNAAKIGRGIWNTANKEETITQLSNLSAPEKKMALDGAVRGLIENIEKRADNANLASTKLTRPYYRDLLSPLVPNSDALDSLVSNLQQRADAFSRNRTWLNQSRTALRGQHIDDQKEIPTSFKDIINKLANTNNIRDRQMSFLLDQNPDQAVINIQRALEMARDDTPVNFVTNPATQKLPPKYYRAILGTYYGNPKKGN